MKKNKPTKKTRKALRHISDIIRANFDVAEADTTFYRTKADIEQHRLQTLHDDEEKSLCLVIRNKYIEQANQALLKMQQLSTLRDMFNAFQRDFLDNVDDF